MGKIKATSNSSQWFTCLVHAKNIDEEGYAERLQFLDCVYQISPDFLIWVKEGQTNPGDLAWVTELIRLEDGNNHDYIHLLKGQFQISEFISFINVVGLVKGILL